MAKISKPFSGNYPISSQFGVRRNFMLNGRPYSDVHDGIDFATPQGTPLFCVDGGTAVRARRDQFGNAWVDIVADSDGGMTRYLHLSRIDVEEGSKVETAQQIGLSGGAAGTWGSGLSTGAHLHFGLFTADTAKGGRAVNPSQLFATWQEPNSNEDDDMYKERLINAIDNNGIFDQATKNSLIKAVHDGNMDYLLAYAGSNPRYEVENWKKYALNILFDNDAEKDKIFTGPYSDIHHRWSANDFRSLVYELKDNRDELTAARPIVTDLKNGKLLTLDKVNNEVIPDVIKHKEEATAQLIEQEKQKAVQDYIQNNKSQIKLGLPGFITDYKVNPSEVTQYVSDSVKRAGVMLDTPEKVNGAVDASSQFIAQIERDFDKLRSSQSIEGKATAMQSLLNVLKDAVLPFFSFAGTILGLTQSQINLYGVRVEGYIGYAITAVSLALIIYLAVDKTIKQSKEKQK